MKKFTYTGEKPIDSNHAGNKARVDVDKILESRYLNPVKNLTSTEFKTLLEKLEYVLRMKNWKEILRLITTKNKKMFIQYPVYYNSLLNKAVYSLLHNNSTVLVVHDVDSLRFLGQNTIEKEIHKFNICNAIIVHNSYMREVLLGFGCKAPMIELDLFDYLLKEIPKNNFRLGNKIVFAGNLGKSEFVKLKEFGDLKLDFNLYGPNFDNKLINHDNVEYKGSFKPDVIPYKLEGSFGLIWDGNSLDTCAGGVGEYLKYNNPHKLSLYIASGLPVIVWKEAAVAKFVEESNIGFTVHSLVEIPDKIRELTPNDYDRYLVNIKYLQEKVCNGVYTNKALDEAEKYLEC